MSDSGMILLKHSLKDDDIRNLVESLKVEYSSESWHTAESFRAKNWIMPDGKISNSSFVFSIDEAVKKTSNSFYYMDSNFDFDINDITIDYILECFKDNKEIIILSDIFQAKICKNYVLVDLTSFRFNWLVLEDNHKCFELQRKAIFDLIKFFNKDEYRAIYFSDYGDTGYDMIELLNKGEDFDRIYEYVKNKFGFLFAWNLKRYDDPNQYLTGYPVIYDDFRDLV